MKTSIPPLDLKAEFREVRFELKRRINLIFGRGRFILGQEVAEFEERFSHFVGTKYSIGVASGSDALLLGLMALGVRPGDEIITTPFTFVSTATAITRLGAKPVFVDIDPLTFNINPDFIKDKITERARGIIPVHLYGNPCRIDEICALAKRLGLFVVEDCAQACGATFRKKQVGSFGEFGAFSFYPTKTLGALGDAGAITTNQKKLYEKIKSLHRHGEEGADHSYRHTSIGINSRLDELQAAILNVKLKHLEKWNQARRRAAERYNRFLHRVGISSDSYRMSFPRKRESAVTRFPTLSEKNVKFFPKSAPRMGASVKAFGNDSGDVRIILPTETPNSRSVYHQYTIQITKRDQLLSYLRKLGISSSVYYPVPLHLQPCFRYLGYRRGDLPEAEKVSHSILSLPLYPQIKVAEQQLVVKSIRNFFKAT